MDREEVEATGHVESAVQGVLPSLEELLAETDDASFETAENRWEDELRFDQNFTYRAVDAERAWVHLRGLEDHYKHKSLWSWFLGVLLAGMIGFQWLLLWQVGAGAWDFTKYDWLLPILLAQNLGQIIGLGPVDV